VHDYWEEVFLLSGDLTVGNDTQGNGGEAFAPFTYACRRRAPRTARSAPTAAACCWRFITTTRRRARPRRTCEQSRIGSCRSRGAARPSI
jgi:hypothetical protein